MSKLVNLNGLERELAAILASRALYRTLITSRERNVKVQQDSRLNKGVKCKHLSNHKEKSAVKREHVQMY